MKLHQFRSFFHSIRTEQRTRLENGRKNQILFQGTIQQLSGRG